MSMTLLICYWYCKKHIRHLYGRAETVESDEQRRKLLSERPRQLRPLQTGEPHQWYLQHWIESWIIIHLYAVGFLHCMSQPITFTSFW